MFLRMSVSYTSILPVAAAPHQSSYTSQIPHHHHPNRTSTYTLLVNMPTSIYVIKSPWPLSLVIESHYGMQQIFNAIAIHSTISMILVAKSRHKVIFVAVKVLPMHFTPSPSNPWGQSPQIAPVPGAGMSTQDTPS